MTTPKPELAPRRTAYVTWAALLLGVLAFAAIASYAGPGLRPGSAEVPPFLADLALGFAAVGVLASRLLPPRLRPPPAVDAEAFALSRNIIAAAFCEGPGLFGVIAWTLTGSERALLAVAIAVVGLVACFPGDARWRSLVGAQPAQRGGRGPSRMVR